jgi:hypothetical protein
MCCGQWFFFLKVQMLCPWLASQEGLSIKWQNGFRTCLNSTRKLVWKLLPHYKQRVHMWRNVFGNNFFPLNLATFFQIKGDITTEYSHFLFLFSHLAEISHTKKPWVLATKWKPNIQIWQIYLFFFPSLVATKNLQNHFFFEFLNLISLFGEI